MTTVQQDPWARTHVANVALFIEADCVVSAAPVEGFDSFVARLGPVTLHGSLDDLERVLAEALRDVRAMRPETAPAVEDNAR